MKKFHTFNAAPLVVAGALATPAAAKRMTHHKTLGMSTRMTTGHARGYSGGSAALQGIRGDSGQGSSSLGNIEGGNIGGGK